MAVGDRGTLVVRGVGGHRTDKSLGTGKPITWAVPSLRAAVCEGTRPGPLNGNALNGRS